MRIRTLFAVVIIVVAIAAYMISDIRFLTVTGDSMNPGITNNDILIVTPTDVKFLEIGDIVTYKLDMGGKGYLFTHRIVDINNGVIKTKGDNMPEEDAYDIMTKDVVGRVVGQIPYIGFLVRSVHTAVGYLALILIPSIILIIKEIKKIMRKS